MKIVANVQPFTVTQMFTLINDDDSVREVFCTTLDKLEEDIAAQADIYNVKEVYLHGSEGFLDKMRNDIARYGITKYNNALEVQII